MTLIDLGIITWPNKPERVEYLERCIRRFRTYLHNHNKIRFLCSIEINKCPVNLVEQAEEICHAYLVDVCRCLGPPCIGSNINNLFHNMKGDYLFLAEDDRLLTSCLDLFRGSNVLSLHPEIAAINYSTQREGRKRFCLQGDQKFEDFVIVSPTSPWAIVNMQILFQKGFVKRYGKYVEGSDDPDKPERNMNIRLKNNRAMCLYSPTQYFFHCGEVSAVNR